MSANVHELGGRARPHDSLAELLRDGTRRIVHPAVVAEFQEVLAEYEGGRLEDGRICRDT